MRRRYEEYLRHEKCMSERSVKDYLKALDLISSRISVLEVNSYREVNDVIRLLKDKNHWSQGTVYKFSILIRNFYKWAVREQMISHNPYPFAEWKKAKPKAPKFLTSHQFQALVNDPFLSHQETTLLFLLWDSGARISEVSGLRQKNIDFEKGTVNIPYEISKGNYSFRYIPLTNKTLLLLKRQFQFMQARSHMESVFLSRSNTGLTSNGLKKIIDKIGLRSSPLRDQMRLSAHQFRHSFGIRMIEKGVPQLIVQKWLGHQSLQMTSHYINMDQESSKRIFDKFVSA
jgi:site-specific recombinase XerD